MSSKEPKDYGVSPDSLNEGDKAFQDMLVFGTGFLSFTLNDRGEVQAKRIAPAHIKIALPPEN